MSIDMTTYNQSNQASKTMLRRHKQPRITREISR